MSNDGKPLAALVRVSFMGTRQAGDANVHADRDQVQTVTGWAAANGHDLEVLPPELDVSGGAPIPQRPSLTQAIEGVEAGVYAGIVVAYLSRLTRSRSGLEIWDRVEAAGGKVYAVAENIDTSTPNGRFVRDIHLANAVREREERGEAFETRARVATMEGIWQRRQTPRGYSRDPETRRLVPDADAGLVRKAFADRAAGRPILDIARDLEMTTSGTRALLANRVYLGELRVRSYVNAAAHPAIVSVELFEAAQHARRTRGARSDQPPALLAGLVRCAGCGHVMSRTSSTQRGTRFWYYGCAPNKSAGRCPEPASISLPRLDDLMRTVAVAKLRRLHSAAAVRTDEGDVIDEELRVARDDLRVFLEVTSSAGLDADTMAAGLRQRQAIIAEIEQRARSVAREVRGPVVEDPEAFWESLGVEHRGVFLRGFVEAVVVRKVGRGKRVDVVDRVRVIGEGAGLFSRKAGAEHAIALRSVWPAGDSPHVIGVQLGEDAL